jgi:hypothetical protein
MAVMAAAIEMPDSMALMLAMAMVVVWHYSEKKKVVVVVRNCVVQFDKEINEAHTILGHPSCRRLHLLAVVFFVHPVLLFLNLGPCVSHGDTVVGIRHGRYLEQDIASEIVNAV